MCIIALLTMLLSIFKLEDDFAVNEPVCSFGKGSHIIGRGKTFECLDKRVSRNHASISICDDKATLTANHQVNPVFYRSANSNHISILQYNIPSQICNGDAFGFFPDNFWFKIRIHKKLLPNKTITLETNGSQSELTNELDITNIGETHTRSNNIANEQNTPDHTENLLTNGNNKRPNEGSFENNINKVQKVCENSNYILVIAQNMESNPLPATELNLQEHPEVTNSDLPEATNSVLEVNTGNPLADGNVEKNDKKNATGAEANTDNPLDDKEDENVASCSTSDNAKKTFRDRCWYSNECYRQNGSHKEKYSHPGDVDYDTDPEDDRPTCSFGGSCYRRNKDHHNEYKHPKPTGGEQPGPRAADYGVDLSNIVVNKRTRKKINTKNDESSEDDYDFNDPFLDDGSEDEYVPNDADDSDE